MLGRRGGAKKRKLVPMSAASAPVLVALRKYPNRSAIDLQHLLNVSRAYLSDKINYLLGEELIYVSGHAYRGDGRGGRAIPQYSVGNLPNVLSKFEQKNALVYAARAERAAKRQYLSNMVRRDWLVSAFFGSVEPHVGAAYGVTTKISKDD